MKYDAIIIGTGQAGSPLAGKLIKHGWKVAIIEKGNFGGACVNVGCTPTKMYVASARRAYVANNSEELGVSASGVKIDLSKIKSRKDGLVEESRENIRKYLEEMDGLTIYKGEAKFVSSHTVEVNGSQLEAEKIFINVGAKPRIPEGFENVEYFTNSSILEIEEVPSHLIVVGGGYIGLEFGQVFRRLGSEVTIIEMSDRLLKKEDTDVSEAIAEILQNEDIAIRVNAKCLSGKKEGNDVVVEVDCDKSESSKIKGSHILIAAGRVPATDALDLDKAGIETDDNGYIKVNEVLETNVKGVYALGDCNGEGAFTHTAYNDYQIVYDQLLGDQKRTLADRFKCYAAYIDPAVARVGLSEDEAREKGIEYQLAKKPMKKIARAREMGETQGFLKILVEKETDKIIGAAFIGPHVDEIIHSIIDVMYTDKPYTVIRDAIHIHPTISELIPTMLKLD